MPVEEATSIEVIRCKLVYSHIPARHSFQITNGRTVFRKMNKLHIYYYFVLLSVLMISSCAEYQFKSDVSEQYEIIRLEADVTPGLTTRGEMQKKIGLPYVSHKEWNVEVYRVLTGQDVFLMGPIIPAIIDVEDIIIYALVVYDEEGVVEEIDWGMYHEDEGRTTLEASGFRFDSYNVRDHFPHTEILLAPLSDSQQTLRIPSPSGTCFLFVAPQDRIGNSAAEYFYNEMIYVDEEPLVDHPVAFPGFFKISLPTGEHEVAVRILKVSNFYKPRYFKRTFLCESGKSVYATPYIQVIDSGKVWDWNKITYQGEILVGDTPMWMFNDMQQILYYAGEWFGQ